MKKPMSKQTIRAILTLGMIQAACPELMRLDMDALSRHMCIFGGTGTGKTKLSVLILRQILSYDIAGATLVTPHPDARDELLAWCVAKKIDPARVQDISPGPDCCVSIDPFAHMPEGNRLEEEARLQATVGRLISAILRNVPLADQQVMTRLKRWLKNVLYCCGKRVDGEYICIQKALILLDPTHLEFDGIMDRLWPHLPDAIRSDFRMLRELKSQTQRLQMVESTMNRLRDVIFDNPIVTQMLSKNPNALDFEQVILQRRLLLVSVPEGDFLSRDQANVIAGLVISMLIGAARQIGARLPEEQRVQHVLMIDEAENFAGEDLRTGFQELRKFKLILVIIVQDISCLLKGEMDLLSKVVSQCGLQGTFQQQDPESLEYLGKAFAYRFLRIKPLYTKQVLPGGYQMIQLQGVSFSSTQGVSVSEAESMTQTRSVTHQEITGQSMNRSISEGLSQTHTEGDSSSSSLGGSKGTARGATWSKGQTNSRQLTHSQGTADSVQRGTSQSTGVNTGTSASHTTGTSSGRSTSQTQGRSSTHGSSETVGESQNVSDTVSSGVTEGRGETENHGTSSTSGTSKGRTQQNSSSRSEGTSDQESSGTSQTRGDARSHVIGEIKTTQNLSANKGVSHSNSSGRSASATEGASEGSSESETKCRGETHARGTSRTSGTTQTTGRSVGQGTIRSAGSSRSEGESSSVGTTENVGNSESRGTTTSQGRTESNGSSVTNGRSVTNSASEGAGTAESRSRGGSRTVSEQENWTEGTGRSSSDSRGLTRTQSDGTGQTWGTSNGQSDGRSTGNTTGLAASQSNGTTVSYSQSPLPIQYVIEVPTGRLEESVQDQIATFIQCIASLPDRTLLMKCRGVNVPFILRVHDVSDPYGTAFRCAEWRADDLRKYIAEIRKAHPCYFLPSSGGGEVRDPAPKKETKRPKRKMEEMTS